MPNSGKNKKGRKVSTRARASTRCRTVYVKDDLSWHLDRRVPVAIILAMAGQLFTGIWWASNINTEVTQLRTDVAKLQVDNKERDGKFEQLISLQSDVKNLINTIGRLERNLDLLVTERVKDHNRAIHRK